MTKYLFKKWIPQIMIACAALFMVGGITQNANAMIATVYTSSNGLDWANPFDPTVYNQTYSTQIAALSPDYTLATQAQVIAAAASDGYAANLTGVASWVSAKFYGGDPIYNTSLCLASVSCDFRLADPFGLASHYRIFPNGAGTAYIFSSTSDSYAGSSSFGIGVLAFKPTPEPSLILPLGAGLMMMGYMVYSRRKD